jgi:NADPH-dependent 2,4-dienoyl-CoA reductase/sulfur reductase-like enzyme
MTNRTEPGPPPGEPGSVAATCRRSPLNEMRQMRIAIVGAGLAGLATAAAFSRAGHDVQVVEQADGLRARVLAINLYPGSTSPPTRPRTAAAPSRASPVHEQVQLVHQSVGPSRPGRAFRFR